MAQKQSYMAQKIGQTMREYHGGTLHSGSSMGPKVTSPKQALAIGYSKGRKGKSK